jgi:hypothetical protein
MRQQARFFVNKISSLYLNDYEKDKKENIVKLKIESGQQVLSFIVRKLTRPRSSLDTSNDLYSKSLFKILLHVIKNLSKVQGVRCLLT